MTHNYPEKIADKSNADITSDSYHQVNFKRNIVDKLLALNNKHLTKQAFKLIKFLFTCTKKI